jgi:hypothetical protein
LILQITENAYRCHSSYGQKPIAMLGRRLANRQRGSGAGERPGISRPSRARATLTHTRIFWAFSSAVAYSDEKEQLRQM